MKRLILILALIFFGSVSIAADNNLETIVLEGTDDGYNIVLKTNSVPEVKKNIKNSNSLILNVKGIKASNSVNAVYKGVNEVNGLIIENISDNEIKIYIQAKDISKATILAQTSDGNAVIISERFPLEKVLWSVAVLGILAVIYKSAKAITDYENSIVIKKDIKSREIELFRNFQRELANMPKINSAIKNSYATELMPRSRRNYKELSRL